MASRKEGVISGDQEAKRRRLKSLKEDRGFKRAKSNSKISTKRLAEWVLHARLGDVYLSGSHAFWWMAGSSQWTVSQSLHTPSAWSLHSVARAEYSWAMIFFLCCVCVLVTQSCLTLCDPTHCIPPGSSVRGVSQARILEWVAIPFSGDLPNPGIKAGSPELQADSLPPEPPGKPHFKKFISWLLWVSVAAWRLSLVAADGGYSLVVCRLLNAVAFLVSEHSLQTHWIQ